MLKKLLFVLVLALGAFVLTGCTKTLEGTGYGLVHGHYVGVVTVKVESGKVTDATIEEYFLPYSWAKVSAELAENADVVSQTYTSRGNPVTAYYAKYLKIGDKTFTAEVTGEAPNQVLKYTSTGIADIEEWVKVEANAKWYVEQVEADLAYTVTAAGAKTNWTINDASASVSMKKSESGYWVVDAPRLGWTGNVEKTVEALIGLDLSEEFELTRDSEAAAGAQFWSIDGTVTGATWSDFPDYFAVAVRAFKNAK